MNTTVTPLRRLGDRHVAAIGFGSMTLTQTADFCFSRSRRAVHAALDSGIRLFDTADVYAPTGEANGMNEMVLRDALDAWPGPLDDIVVATKGGHLRFPDTDTWWIDGTYGHLRNACIASIKRLGMDPLPLYQHHRPDPRLPYEESMLALRALYDEGLVRQVGISNVDVGLIRIAKSVLGDALVSVQNEYSPGARGAEMEIALCEEMELAFLSWGPFGGMRHAKALGNNETSAFSSVAKSREVSIHQVALAWQLHKSPVIIPIPGASRPESVSDSAAAASLELTVDELAWLNTSRIVN